jgi:phosphatidylglycerophosphatase A
VGRDGSNRRRELDIRVEWPRPWSYAGPASGSPLLGRASPRSRAVDPIDSPASHGLARGLTRGLALTVATGAGSGLSPFAPGTAGSAVGVLLFWPLAALGLPLFAATTVGVIALGIWAADEAERIFASKDDGRIVVDEVAGQLLTLLPLVPAGRARSIPWLVTGFVAFRVLDVWKPGPVRWLQDNLRGGAGVVLDDVAAGAIGAAGMAVALQVLG